MPHRSDIVFHFDNGDLNPLPSRSMREGLLGKTLEDALQTFLEKYPDIIPGKQIDPVAEDPPRFVLLRREMPVSGWSLDHLFVDQKGILTLVETKLFQNPESRREVIGQIIEYAAHAEDFWASDTLRQKAEEFWINKNGGKGLDEILEENFGPDLDIDEFWETVQRNLKSGRFRLIIAADELRPEVRRMIEYLNREMQNAELLGLELIFYGQDPKSLVLVPRLVGQTQSVVNVKSYKWTVDMLRKAYGELPDNKLGQSLRKILDWAVDKQFFMPTVAINPTFGLRGKNKERIFTIGSDGVLHSFLNPKCFLNGDEGRDELVSELKRIELLDQNFDAQEVVSGRNLNKKIFELNEYEFDEFIKIYDRYCG